ncbi:cell division control protein 23 [Naematelia encephala]|uniref:Cell division control protein 23 n=1 Tax=Naematelia encephala TaxID=71784 RepID=A0A1Y2B1M5_9TREE|nr:cell division control protein 23 [Naematelia encephala]
MATHTARVQIAHDIRRTVRELRDRGLLVSAKWASELLSSLAEDVRSAPHLPFSPPLQPHHMPTTSASPGPGPRPSIGEFLPSPGPGAFGAVAGPSRSMTSHGIEMEEEEDVLEEDEFQLARGYFDMKEFDRVVHTLQNAKGKRARFLRVYSAYLSADRKAQESLPHFLDTKEERLFLYPAITPLLDETASWSDDPYISYLRGILHMRIDQRHAAVECLVKSVTERPYNYSAWSQLAQLVNSADMFIELKEMLPSSVMLSFFAITVMLDLHTATDLVMNMIKELLEIFPHSVHLQAQRALVYYHMREFEAAERAFDEVRRLDPFRMEDVDIYSNMLYVMDRRAKLATLAHEYAEIDRNRAEVCCLIGNYYSSRNDHIKAITYFKRALLLNREYLPAWTLMGHEFVETKNSHAAIEAYRKAIDVNAKDYRAWYGLGQAYELLDMPMYAIEYYNQATSLRPYDCRMWSALAQVYENLQRLPDAIKSHVRALLGADRQQTPSILRKLADLHTTLSDGAPNADAVEYHKKLLALNTGTGGITEDIELADSYLAVAEWESTRGPATASAGGEVVGGGGGVGVVGGDMALAIRYLEKVAGMNCIQRDRAEDLLRELRLREATSAV